MKIVDVLVEQFRVPLPVTLSDATHGEMTHFGLVTVRVVDEQGREGLGYTYTVHGIGGSAIHALIRDDLGPFLPARDRESLEDFWASMWWTIHSGRRGGVGGVVGGRREPARRGQGPGGPGRVAAVQGQPALVGPPAVRQLRTPGRAGRRAGRGRGWGHAGVAAACPMRAAAPQLAGALPRGRGHARARR